jgi:hypothetical protein
MDRHEIALELDSRLAHLVDDLMHLLPPRFGQRLLIAHARGQVQRQDQAQLLGSPLERVERIARQSASGDTDRAPDNAQEEQQAQSYGRPSPGKRSPWAAPTHRARVDCANQRWRRAEHGQGGQELVLSLVSGQGRRAA